MASLHQAVKKTPLIWIAAAAVLIVITPLPQLHRQPVDHLFKITAKDSTFIPAAMVVQPGDRVTISFEALDVAHGLAIDGYPLDLTSEPGQPVQVTFTAQKAGVFPVRCSLACGNLHPFMLGKFQVGPNQALWKAGGLALLAALFAGWMSVRRS